MSEWAARLGLVFPEKARADFDQFVEEVHNENVEYLSLKRQYDEFKETKPTYEQISQERILDEANKNIQVLKSFETILQERTQSYGAFFTAQGKYTPSFEIFQYCEGTLRQALDALFVFLEQVCRTLLWSRKTDIHHILILRSLHYVAYLGIAAGKTATNARRP